MPHAVISDLLDAPEADRPVFGEWTKTLGLAFLSISDAEVRGRVEQALSVLTAEVGSLELSGEARWVPYAAIRCFEPPVVVALG